MHTKRISIQIVEDYNLIRNSLKFLLENDKEIEVTDCYSAIEDYLAQSNRSKPPDLLLAGFGTDIIDSTDTIQKIKEFSPETKIAVLSKTSFLGENQFINDADVSCCFSIETKYEQIVETLKALFND